MLLRTAIAVLMLAACASAEGGDPAPSPTAVDETTVTGTLGGDAELEGGCAWLDTPDGRFQVIYPDGYEVSFEPLRLEGPDGVVAEEGDRVTVRGEESSDLVSICQVGTLFAATEVSG